MRKRIWQTVAVSLGAVSAFAAAFTVTAIYREGNLLAWGVALLLPLAALAAIYRDAGKRVITGLFAILLMSVTACIWLALGEDFDSLAVLGVTLVGLLVPIGVDLMLIESDRRVAVSRAVAYTALATFILAFSALAGRWLSAEHLAVMENDYALIREVVQHVQVRNNAIVFDHVDPKRKSVLKNRIAVLIEGKIYPLSNAHFESVSRESTVRKQTEKSGSRRTTVVSRERDEDMRVVVHVDRKPTSIVLYSTRGPVTICEEAIDVPGEDDIDEPVS